MISNIKHLWMQQRISYMSRRHSDIPVIFRSAQANVPAVDDGDIHLVCPPDSALDDAAAALRDSGHGALYIYL